MGLGGYKREAKGRETLPGVPRFPENALIPKIPERGVGMGLDPMAAWERREWWDCPGKGELGLGSWEGIPGCAGIPRECPDPWQCPRKGWSSLGSSGEGPGLEWDGIEAAWIPGKASRDSGIQEAPNPCPGGFLGVGDGKGKGDPSWSAEIPREGPGGRNCFPQRSRDGAGSNGSLGEAGMEGLPWERGARPGILGRNSRLRWNSQGIPGSVQGKAGSTWDPREVPGRDWDDPKDPFPQSPRF